MATRDRFGEPLDATDGLVNRIVLPDRPAPDVAIVAIASMTTDEHAQLEEEAAALFPDLTTRDHSSRIWRAAIQAAWWQRRYPAESTPARRPA